ncbi:MAG: hypothetical protein ACRC50_13860 [Gaiella sp.]
MTALLLVHAGATVAMVGLVWFVQLVHYPLFAHVGRDGFALYEAQHTRRTTWLVAPLMLVEAATALVLLAADPSLLTVAGAALLGIVWLSTALVQVPLHGRLERGFDAEAHRRLVRSNAVRTAAWTGRAVIALALLA